MGYAASSLFPPKCQGLEIQQDTLMIKAKKPEIVLIHNQSNVNLWITHPITEVSASAGWSTQLDPDKWLALAVDNPFELNCIESQPGHEQQISCVTMISACEWSDSHFSGMKKGTFWLAENMDLDKILVELSSRGYKLPHSG